MNWEIKIEKVDNGYILTHKSENDETLEVKHIIEESEAEYSEFYALRELFWYLQDYFCVYNSKHNKKRLEIEVVDNE